MVLHSLPSGFGEMLYYRRRSHIYGRKGNFKVVILWKLDHIHRINTQLIVLYSLSSRFREMLYQRRSHIYGRKGNFKVVILWKLDHIHTMNIHNLWFYTHSLVVSERWYITEEDHTYMEEKESSKL